MLNVRFVNPSKPFEFNICKKPVKEVYFIKCELDNFSALYLQYIQYFNDANKDEESCATLSILVSILFQISSQ